MFQEPPTTFSYGLHPIIGQAGLYLEIILAVFPDLVTVTIAVAFRSIAVVQVAWAIIKGRGVNNRKATASLCVGKDEMDIVDNFKEGDIIVLPETSNDIMDELRQASGNFSLFHVFHFFCFFYCMLKQIICIVFLFHH